ncbi:hypothetical protein LOC68_18755 [Blastopirellula sp. JC732]|uniref:GlsB/YeaQ/YmgE family stress response membrane protein n=1 Tax=Blastopirellula sediminis TaxID=2894196 RepID=A0A9X1MQD5_9BACT|nr:hypothetical protein [Blastopirellula sediminis]MCC9606262.1 hypothetical protein [Blastopirellula sediminis]MCC9630440.1 hypothetical protein [Blastopirellula sediminis]
MTLIEFLLLLLIAGVCGSIAQSLAGYSHGGCLVSIALGFIGALLGAWLSRLVGIGDFLAVQIGGATFPIIWSVIGGALFAAALAVLGGRNRNVE